MMNAPKHIAPVEILLDYPVTVSFTSLPQDNEYIDRVTVRKPKGKDMRCLDGVVG